MSLQLSDELYSTFYRWTSQHPRAVQKMNLKMLKPQQYVTLENNGNTLQSLK